MYVPSNPAQKIRENSDSHGVSHRFVNAHVHLCSFLAYRRMLEARIHGNSYSILII